MAVLCVSVLRSSVRQSARHTGGLCRNRISLNTQLIMHLRQELLRFVACVGVCVFVNMFVLEPNISKTAGDGDSVPMQRL